MISILNYELLNELLHSLPCSGERTVTESTVTERSVLLVNQADQIRMPSNQIKAAETRLL